MQWWSAMEGQRVAIEVAWQWRGEGGQRALRGWLLWKRAVERQWEQWDTPFRQQVVQQSAVVLQPDPSGPPSNAPPPPEAEGAAAQALVTVAMRKWEGGWEGFVGHVCAPTPLPLLDSGTAAGSGTGDGKCSPRLRVAAMATQRVGERVAAVLQQQWQALPQSQALLQRTLGGSGRVGPLRSPGPSPPPSPPRSVV